MQIFSTFDTFKKLLLTCSQNPLQLRYLALDECFLISIA